MLRQLLLSRRAARRLPIFRLLALAEVALLARRHLAYLDPHERRRLAELVRRGRRLTPEERAELRALAGKLEPRAFATDAAAKLSPVGFPRAGRRH